MLLNEAYGSLNALSGLADDWLADRPQVYSHPIDASKCALTDRRVISYAGTLMDARKTLVAAIRHCWTGTPEPCRPMRRMPMVPQPA